MNGQLRDLPAAFRLLACLANLMRRICLALVLVVLTSAAAGAGTGEQDPAQSPAGPPRSAPDFLFGRPRGSVGIRGGWVFARARSDLFTFFRRHLTLDGSDFNGPIIGVDLGMSVAPRAELMIGLDFSRAAQASEYREFVETDERPIRQTTTLSQLNLSVGVKVALTPRGRSVSQLAWIPSAVAPYAGGGVGALLYRLHQEGDFVDFVDLSIFEGEFRSDGWTPSAHAFGGTEIRPGRRVFLTLEARYVGRRGSDPAFSGFEPIDLTGLRTGAGVTWVF